MTFKNKVTELLQSALDQKPNLFLIDFTITESNKITIVLDGDNGVTLQDCMDVSRAIEHNIDRDEFDFGLDVASAGVSTPLKLVRQYKKNVGRNLKVNTASDVYEAQLVNADDEKITLSWTAREPKKVGKGKETVQKEIEIPYSEIKQAVVTITF
ncbi:ribosome assembly cofactor RimP [Flavobacterium sp.]|uniref:ribosome assembly cofactor RimP n=1 Tax=Flavobacterium sp. TaxID=239 RepID=UPI002FD8DB14